MAGHKITMGILALDTGWIAGILYAYCAVRAIQLADRTGEIKLKLIGPRGMDMTHFKPFEDVFESVHYFDLPKQFQSKSGLDIRLQRYFLRTHLKSIIEKQCDVIFPIRRPLGFSLSTPSIAWIPDCQHTRFPEFFSDEECRQRDKDFQLLSEQTTQLVVSSQNSRTDLVRLLGKQRNRINVCPFRTFPEPDWFVGDPAETARRFHLPDKYLYFPSQQWKHKNHLTLLKAIRRLAEHPVGDVTLVLTGHDHDYRHPEYSSEIRSFVAENRLERHVRWLGVLERPDQIQLMRQAAAVIQPSYFEGWSMLLEDCRAIGKTAFVSDIPVHREQEYEKAHFFDPNSESALTDLLLKHWGNLKAGPDAGAERAARDKTIRLCEESGQKLGKVIRQAIVQ